MGKQKNTTKSVQLIRHLLRSGWSQTKVATFMNLTRGSIEKIHRRKQWSEVQDPTPSLGDELLYRYINRGNLNEE